MSRYINRVLGPDERVICEAEIHWYVYLKGFSLIILGALLGRYGLLIITHFIGFSAFKPLSQAVTIAALIVVGIGTLYLLGAYVRQISTELVITNRRVIAKYGFVATTTYELMLTKVEGANIDQTVLGRMLGFGTLMVKGTGGGISPIDHIAKPYQFHNFLMKVLEKQQSNEGHSSRND